MKTTLLVNTGILLVTAACAGATRTAGERPVATAELRDATGASVGSAQLTELADGAVRLELEVRGLPVGEKGVHLHETGACEPPTFESAGKHLNSEGKQHGLENPAGPHAGDLPNLTVAADGSGSLSETTRRVSLAGGAGALLDDDGSALVVHAGPDDQRTDPAGNSGARIACGVIGGG